MAKLTVKDLDVQGKRVLVRVDYNVPLKEQDGAYVVTDATRIEATLPTLKWLIEKGGKLILMSHLDRPKGQRDPSKSLRPAAQKLQELIGRPVQFVEDCIGPAVEQAVAALRPGDILLLENLRFHAEEEANDPNFAEQLARLADVYVNDAFGSAHRAHASTEGVARKMAERGAPCAAGLLMERELKFLGEELENPARPFVVILGGAKVSDKIGVINRLLEKAEALLIGGAMAYTFNLARGYKAGQSLVEADKVVDARKYLAKAEERGVKFLLPVDHVVATRVETDQKDKKGRPVVKYQDPHPVDDVNVPEGECGLDIGPKTIQAYREVIAGAKTILWNGPMGLFEDDRFAGGTKAIAQAVAEATQKGALSIIGGGDSVKALNQMGMAHQVTFVSTGGGASLEFLEGKVLPGVAALTDR